MASKPVDVDVYQLRNDSESDAKQVRRIHPGEANVIVTKGYACWRGRRKKSITLLIPVRALDKFVGMMRHRAAEPSTATDSKTFRKLYGPGNPGYEHIRNDRYEAGAHHRDISLPVSSLGGVEVATA